ncbi:hypothetical protein DVH26_06495 [Paenibacillus sp. H1-7]|uniref:hypothetical protein n=1 Tax=Paenibacillus sp. H1-7 TaxID=2282849 RepID=UPI001EF8041C|nr:hypothetical protein [Paenibacillus sp. H1-7]ULL14125.1 hypothetical protein DVH26_06495 [Paenibacillus sp. H1-7]
MKVFHPAAEAAIVKKDGAVKGTVLGIIEGDRQTNKFCFWYRSKRTRSPACSSDGLSHFQGQTAVSAFGYQLPAPGKSQRVIAGLRLGNPARAKAIRSSAPAGSSRARP